MFLSNGSEKIEKSADSNVYLVTDSTASGFSSHLVSNDNLKKAVCYY